MLLVRGKPVAGFGFAVSLNTNGVYDNPDIIDSLASLGLEQITISIDGAQKTHDRLRGEGNFERAIKSLRLLFRKGAVLRTNTVLTKNSTAEMEEIIGIAGPYVSEMNFFYVRTTGRAKKILDEAVSFEDLDDFNKRAAQIVRRYPTINILFGSQVMRVNSVALNSLGLQLGGPDGFTRINLSADGSILPGGYAPYIDKTLNLGDIREEGYTTLQICREPAKLKQFRDRSEQLVRRCLSCPELDVRCPGINVEMDLVRQKSPQIGNPYCKLDQNK